MTKQIISRLQHTNIRFFALEGLSRKEMAGALAEAMVYIDFGDHPGKDRIPREAALAGNIIISSNKGSAAFFDDLPISEKYKFHIEQVEEVAIAIEDSIANYDELIHDFDFYLNIIRNEKKQFYSQAASLFISEKPNAVLKFARNMQYRFLPLRQLIFNAELLMNVITRGLSASAKKNIRKIPLFKK